MISVVCCAALISVVSASYHSRPLTSRYGPAHRRAYGGVGGHGGGIEPLTLLLLQKDGGDGNSALHFDLVMTLSLFIRRQRRYQQSPSSSLSWGRTRRWQGWSREPSSFFLSWWQGW